MRRLPIAASTLLVASLIGAGAFAAASRQTPQVNDDAVAGLAVMAQLDKAGSPAGSTAAPATERVADASGKLHVPENYRTNYRFIGSWAVAGDDKGSGSKEIHVVYASPGAVEGYLGTGHFEDGAVLVKEVFETKTGDMTTGTVSHADNLKGWFVMIRDAKNTAHPGNPLWGDGWGWSWFDFGNTTKTTSTDYKSDCMGCHVPATPTDFIYVEGYPSLKRR